MAKQNGKRDFSKFEEAIAKKEGGGRDFSRFEDALKKKVPTTGSVESQDLSQGVLGGVLTEELAGSTSELAPSTSESQESVLNLGKVKQAQVQGVQSVIDPATQQPIVPVSELGETLPPVIKGTPPEQPQLPIEQVTSPELTGPTRTEAQAAMGTTPWQGREAAELEFDAQDKAIREAATRRKETIFPRWMGVDIDPETGKLIKTKGTGLINNISFDIEEDLDAKEAIVNKDKKDIFPERIIDQVELGSEDTQERINQSAIDRQVNLSRGIIRNERKQNQLEKSLTKEDKDVIVDWAKKYEDKYFQDIDGLDKYETDASLDMDKLKNSLPEDISDFNKERIVNGASLRIQERYEEKKKQLETDRRMMELEDKAGLTESDEQMRKMRAGELPEGSQFAVELINVPGYKNPNLTQEEHDELMAYRKKKSTDRESYMLENQLIAKLGREDYNKRVDEEANSLYSEHELIEKKLVSEINELYDQEKPDYKKINALELKLSEFREAQAFVKGTRDPLTAIDYMLSDTPTDDKVYDPVTKKRIGIEDASPALIDWNRRVDKAAIDFSRTNGVGDLKALQSRYYSEMKYLEKLGSEEEVQEAQASFMAVSKALDLNKSITNLQRNAWERTVEAVAEGIGFNYQSDEDEALAYTEALQDKGLKITDAEFDRVQQRFVDKLGSTVGGSIPVMMEIMFWTAVTQGTGMTTALETGLAKLGSRLAVGERSAKAINATAKVVSNAISREGQFQLAGEMGGAGESLGAEVGTSLAGNLAFLGNSKVGRILRTAFTQTGRASGETLEEYTGELWAELMKDKSFSDAFETVIGEDPLEKLALTYITGSIFAVGKVGTDFKNSKVAQDMGDVLLNYDGDNEIVNEAKKTAEAINQVKPGTQLEIDFEGKETDKREFKGEDLLGREGDDREGDVVQVKEVEGELSNYTVDGKVRSDNQVIENLSDPEFVEKVKSGETNLDIQNPSPEVKTALEESGLLETKQDVKEEVTPEEEVDETPVEGEQQVTEDVVEEAAEEVTEDVVEEVTPERVVKEKKEVSIKPIDFEDFIEDEDGVEPFEATEKAENIAKDTGVGILRGKEIKSVATDSEGEVVGGLWTEVDGDSFSFDVAIDEKSQGQGVGEKLVNEAFQEFEFNADGNEELKYNIEVTNPSMEKLLSKYGFVVDERIGGTTKMSHPTNNPKLETKTKQDAKIKETKVDETKVEETKVLEEPVADVPKTGTTNLTQAISDSKVGEAGILTNDQKVFDAIKEVSKEVSEETGLKGKKLINEVAKRVNEVSEGRIETEDVVDLGNEILPKKVKETKVKAEAKPEPTKQAPKTKKEALETIKPKPRTKKEALEAIKPKKKGSVKAKDIGGGQKTSTFKNGKRVAGDVISDTEFEQKQGDLGGYTKRGKDFDSGGVFGVSPESQFKLNQGGDFGRVHVLLNEKDALEFRKKGSKVNEEVKKLAREERSDESEVVLDLRNRDVAKTKGPKVFKKQNAREVDKLTKEAKTSRQKTALGTVKNIIKALGSINPDLEVLVHETEDSYLEAMGKEAKGTSGSLATDGKIHLNLSRIKDNTALHEAAHVVIAAHMKANPKAVTEFKKQLEGILPKSDLDSLNDFANDYEKDGQQEVDEEFVVEALSRIANGEISLNKTTLEKIKELLRTLAKKLGMVSDKIKLTGKEDVKAFAEKLTEAFTEGREINIRILNNSSVDGESGSEIVPAPLIKRQISKDSRDESFDTTIEYDDSNFPGEINMPPKETIDAVLEKSGGAAMFINSDGTKVGVRSNGEKLEGGPRYTYLVDNQKDNIGFAATSTSHVSIFHNIATKLTALRDSKTPEHKGKPVAVFVTVQNADTMLGEWYAGEFFMEGIDKALTDKKIKGGVAKVRKLINEALTFKKAIAQTAKELKVLKNSKSTPKTDKKIKQLENQIRTKKEAAKKADVKRFLDLINSSKFETHNGRLKIAQEFASKKYSFGFRVNLLKTLIPLKTATGSNSEIKKALLDVNHGRQDLYNEHMDEILLDKLKRENFEESSIGGVTMGGFYMDPYSSKEEFMANRGNGVDHAQFNESFSSNGETFAIDAPYNVNKMFPEMGYPTNKGYEFYNDKNGTDFNKKNTDLNQRFEIANFLSSETNNDSKFLTAPFTSIGGSMYTSKIHSNKPKFQKSISEDIEATKDYISQLNETPFLSGITSEEILKEMTDAGYDVDLETVNKLRNEALEVKSKAEPIKTKKTPKTVMARFIQSGLTEEEANRLAGMAEKKQVSNEQRLAIIDKIEAEVGLDKAYELTSNPEANSIFSQETIDYFATAKADSLKKKAAKTESIKERNKLINQAAEIQTKLATEAERAGQITQFKNATYDRFPDMRISDTVVDTINKKTAEELSAPSSIQGMTVGEEIEGIRTAIEEEIKKEVEKEIEGLKEQVRKLKEDKAGESQKKKGRKQISDALADIKKIKNRKGGGVAGASIIPGLSADMVNAIAKLVSGYVNVGIGSTKAIVDKVMKDLKSAGIKVNKSDIEKIADANPELSKIAEIKAKEEEAKAKAKEQESKLQETIEDFYINGNSEKTSLAEHMADKLGMTTKQAQGILDETGLESKIQKKVKETANKELDKNLKKSDDLTPEEKAERKKQQAENNKIVNKVSKTIKLGGLAGRDFTNDFAEKYELGTVTAEDMQLLEELVKDANRFEKSGQRELHQKTQRLINTKLRKMAPRDAAYYGAALMEVAYLNALSGLNTQGNANLGAISTSSLHVLGKSLEQLIRGRFGAVTYGFRAMGKSLKAASKAAQDARRFNYSKFQDHNSYMEGATNQQMGVVEEMAIDGFVKYIRRNVDINKPLKGNIKVVAEGIRNAVLQYARMNFLLNASDAFLSTQFSEFNNAIELYNKTTKEDGFSGTINNIVNRKDLIKRLDKSMGYDNKAKFKQQAKQEVEAEKLKIDKEVDKLLLSPEKARLEKKRRRNLTISKGYEARRVQDLMVESRDQEIYTEAVKTARDWIMLSDPDGIFGFINEGWKKLATIDPKTKPSKIGVAMSTLAGLTIMFSRMTAKTANAVLTSIPVIGMIPASFGVTKNKEGDWKWDVKAKHNPLLFKRRMAANAIMTTATAAIFTEMFEWDDEDDEWKLDPNRLIDITAGGFGGTQASKNEQTIKGYSGYGVAISFRSSSDEEFGPYRTLKYLPQALPGAAIIGNYADRTRGLGSESQLENFEERNGKWGMVSMPSVGVSLSQMLEGSFNSIGRATKKFQMSDAEESTEKWFEAGFDLVTNPLKGISQPNFYRDFINEMGLRGDVKKKYNRDYASKLKYDYYALDAESENKTDIFGNEYKTQGKLSQWVNGVMNENYDKPEWKILFKYPEVTITPIKSKDEIAFNGNTIKIIDENIITEYQNSQKKSLKKNVLENIDLLNTLDSRNLQIALDKIRNGSVNKAKGDIILKYENEILEGNGTKIKIIK